ncbi:alpha-1,2-fucosyltransferase [Asticcacaulis sp. AND118]|uniref:alpha-1,2-fucosyltransferase n=1 Tax=Asticcacaulis sp. AND118 TaxID=2840468 RepID=UPI001CFF717F|nr:alpha-1,2-fucosyltransferase [Asticcacaulis sp. AND118]UDF03388.1 alpha-1,2-fucosyltransferase [Asticcacaulis sp. AND118]
MVRLLGGLANQLFQYALGRTLAIRTGALLRFDTRDLDNDTLRDYALDVLNVRGCKASLAELDYFRPENSSKITLLQEKSFTYDPTIRLAQAPIYLSGYWQSEKYFFDMDSVLRQDITLATPLSQLGNELAKRMEATNSVSVHVRRGDYVTNSHTNTYHGAVGVDYINKSIQHIHTTHPSSVFFVFSDDIEWTKANLKSEAELVFVPARPDACDAEDMILMGRCKHHILSNSSFSWWGAWLNPSRRKIVIAPSPWFRNPENDTRDLYGERWLKLSIQTGDKVA